MALLTAEDVLNKAFSKTKYREGFDQDEVDDFLDEVAHTITSLTAERDDLAQRLAQAQAGAPVSAPAETAAVESTEGGLLAAATDPTPPSATGMLAMAQKLHDEYVQAGEEERERLIEEAKAKAESIVEQAEVDATSRMNQLVDERSELERKIDDLRRFERDYRGRLKSYLENLLGDLDHGTKNDTPGASASGLSAAGDTGSAASAPSVRSAPVTGTGPSFGTSAPSSPWADARPQDPSSSPSAANEQPAPWGASGYQPRHETSANDIAPTFGAPSAQESDEKNF